MVDPVLFTLKNFLCMYKWKIFIKKRKSARFLALKIWALAVLKFFDVVLKFELPSARFLNFPKNSASVLMRPVLIIGDCVYTLLIYADIYTFFLHLTLFFVHWCFFYVDIIYTLCINVELSFGQLVGTDSLWTLIPWFSLCTVIFYSGKL